jgi:hypothetical protein
VLAQRRGERGLDGRGIGAARQPGARQDARDRAGFDREPGREPLRGPGRQPVRGEGVAPGGRALVLGQRRQLEREVARRQRRRGARGRAHDQRAGEGVERGAHAVACAPIVAEPVEREARHEAAQRGVDQLLSHPDLEGLAGSRRRLLDEAHAAPAELRERRREGSTPAAGAPGERDANRPVCRLRGERADEPGERGARRAQLGARSSGCRRARSTHRRAGAARPDEP